MIAFVIITKQIGNIFQFNCSLCARLSGIKSRLWDGRRFDLKLWREIRGMTNHLLFTLYLNTGCCGMSECGYYMAARGKICCEANKNIEVRLKQWWAYLWFTQQFDDFSHETITTFNLKSQTVRECHWREERDLSLKPSRKQRAISLVMLCAQTNSIWTAWILSALQCLMEILVKKFHFGTVNLIRPSLDSIRFRIELKCNIS